MYLESSWVEDQPSIILEGETWTNRLKFQYEVLGWPQRLFRFFHNILHKKPNELCGQHNISLSVRQSFYYNNKPPRLGNDRPVRQGCFVPRSDQPEAGWQLRVPAEDILFGWKFGLGLVLKFPSAFKILLLYESKLRSLFQTVATLHMWFTPCL